MQPAAMQLLHTDINTDVCVICIIDFMTPGTADNIQYLLISGTRSCEGSRTFRKNRATISARL